MKVIKCRVPFSLNFGDRYEKGREYVVEDEFATHPYVSQWVYVVRDIPDEEPEPAPVEPVKEPEKAPEDKPAKKGKRSKKEAMNAKADVETK